MRLTIALCFVGLLTLSLFGECESKFRLKRVFKGVERAVRNIVVKPVKKVVREVIEKPVKNILRAVGLKKKVRKSSREFKQEVEHSRVIVTEDSYRVEKVTPCERGHHDIVETEQPVEFHLEDDVIIVQDRYCRKCGQHFFTEPREEL